MKILIKMAMILSLVLSIGWTYKLYYNDFTQHSSPDFERDRMRGHSEVYKYVSNNFSPEDTLLVLGDGISVSPFASIFHNFEHPYQFIMWPNYLSGRSTVEDWNKFEDMLAFRGFKYVVYIFSTSIFSDGSNDWRMFLDLHRDTKPFEYSYDGHPLLLVYAVRNTLP